jgi:flagellar hook-associated protein 3 FlgL
MLHAMDAATQRFLADMGRIDDRIDRANREITSGRRITQASDAPGDVGAVLRLKSRVDMIEQCQTNLQQAKSETDTAEQSLETAVSVMERVRQLAAQAVTETETPEARQTIGVELRALRDQMVSIAGTMSEGRYVFSGDDDQVAPYAVDDTQPNGVTAYTGAPSTRQMLHPSGATFGIARTAQEIFDNPAASVFGAITALIRAVENGPTVAPGDPLYNGQYDAQTDAINAALGLVGGAQDHLNAELSFYGTVQNRVSEAINSAAALDTREKTELSRLQDADIVQSITDLNQAITHREAALNARARMPNSSLFDYLG